MGIDAHSGPEETRPDETTRPAAAPDGQTAPPTATDDGTATTPVGRPIDVRLLVAGLSAGTGVLLIINLVLKGLSTPEQDAPYLGLFDVNRELNVPTVWNAALLIGAGAAFLLVASLTERRRVGWVLAAAATGVMATDEMLQFHEQLRRVGSLIENATGIFLPTYTWLVPGIIIALAGITVIWVWTAHHPSPSGRLLRIAVLMYGGGAVGVEGISGWIDNRYGFEGLGPYAWATAVEEGLEMMACVVAIVAGLRMLRSIDLPGGRRAFFAPLDAREAAEPAAS